METELKHIVGPSDKLFKIMMTVISVIGIFLAGELLYQFSALPQNQPHEITVSGEGKAYAKSDVATISFGAHTEAVKSQDAVSQNNKIMDAVISAIRGLGVAEKDIQTTLYSLQPLYNYGYPVPIMAPGTAGGVSSYPVPVNRKTFNGYSLDQQISVKIRNFDNIDAILDKAAQAGANTIGQLSFTIDNIEKVQAQARAQAIMKAKEKANSMVSGTGLQLGKLVNISEGYGGYPQPLYTPMGVMAKDSSVAPQVQAGQMEVNSTVTLTYQVK